jgi:glutaredoxin-like protein NrdH
MMKITLWEKPNCVQCNQTKKEFDKRGIIYQVKRLDRSAKAVDRFLEMGLLAAPIVETDDRRWSGFRLEKIKSLEYHLKHERMRGVNVPLQPITQIAEEVGNE